jgi:hypothetical protein
LKTALGALLSIVLLSSPMAGTAMDECSKAACEAQRGRWSCAQREIPGDGAIHDFAVRGSSANAAFVCGQAAAMRQGLDSDFVASCMLDPEQPPSIENSLERRCTRPSDDMSVEVCVQVGGSNPNLSCRYANPAGASRKTIRLCGCWR